jgi:hypothetical protein
MPLRLPRHVLLSSVIASTFVVCLPSIAHAQGIGVLQEQSLPRIGKDDKVLQKRPIAQKPEGISFQDCVDDQKIRFPLQLGSFEAQASLQMWAGLAGADCKVQQNRSGVNTTCWQLAPSIPLTITPVVEVPVRTIMSGAGPGGPPRAAENANESICGKVDFTQLSVQILYFAPGQLATPAQNKDLTIEVDTIGPAAPSGLRTEPGNGAIGVRWDNISGEGGLSQLTGVKVYCDLLGSDVTAAGSDAATTTPEPAEPSCTEVPNTPDANDDSGADAGTTLVCDDAGTSSTSGDTAAPAGSCPSTNLKAGVIPDAEFSKQFECGSFAGNTGSGTEARTLRGQPLLNQTAENPNVMYAVSVAATDLFGNVGPLSDPKCEYPEPTTNFWDAYRKAGGDAGGGCATSGAPVGSLTALTALGLTVLSTLRRRRASSGKRNGRRAGALDQRPR